MTLHGNALNDTEAGQLSAIRDRHRTPFSGGGVWWYEIDRLLGWHDRLVTLLAEAASENERLRASLKSADDAMREAGIRVGIDMGDDTAHWMANEIDRLRAELLKTPPTLEWLNSILGPGDDRGGLVIWGPLPRTIYYYKNDHRTEICRVDDREWDELWTRADVLAAVKGAE